MINYLIFHLIGGVIFSIAFLIFCVIQGNDISKKDLPLIILTIITCLVCWEFGVIIGCYQLQRDMLK